MKLLRLGFPLAFSLLASCFFLSPAFAQTSATGQLSGTVTDPSGAAVPQANVTVTNSGTALERHALTTDAGTYSVPLLSPGVYTVTVAAQGFKTQTNTNVVVQVATTTTLNFAMSVGGASEVISVEANAEVLQTQEAVNGGTVGGTTVTGLPLTNRNYTQVLALNPGVAGQVPNAATLGRNNVDVNVNGTRVMDNSYEMDGQDVSNMQTQGTTNVVSIGGISIPSPDAIEEFKVQTSLYDASYGRGAGANVDVVTKSGNDSLHGDLFEFVRNDVFNANDFFLNSTGQPRAVLKQNQFGGTIGGPILKKKIFYFGSYQGTRQVNGLGSSSLRSVVLPPLTDDRSAAAIGSLFCGQTGKNGGVAIACDGSNINPIAMTLLNFKLPDGSFFIPTPQVIQSNGTGFSTFSIPSRYSENQYLVNTDYVLTPKQQLAERFFWAKAPQIQSFSTANVPGSGITAIFRNVNTSLKHTYVLSSNFVNEVSGGYHRTYGITGTNTPVSAADLGIASPCNLTVMPVINVQGSINMGGSGNDIQDTVSQAFTAQEQISWLHAKHNIRAGFGWERISTPVADPGVTRGTLTFLSFQDFLLGMSAAQNGSAFSNIYTSNGSCGDTSHSFRVSDLDAFVQDDYKVNSHLTLNLGLRWEAFGAISDSRGRLTDFWPAFASNDFSSGATLSGFVVPSNYGFDLPDGVTRNSNKTFAANPWSAKNFGPRIGFSWVPPRLNKMVVRGGYGLYFSRTSVNDAFQLFSNPPFYQSRSNSGVLNALATFANPFNPGPPNFDDFPIWPARSGSTALGFTTVDPNWRVPVTQQWALNVQYEVTPSTVLQVGYVGSRGEHLVVTVSANEPFLASPEAPVNGITTNTIQNAIQRVPILGLSPSGLSDHIPGGDAMYNGLQASLNKKMGKFVQFGVAYTYSKALTDITGTGTFPSGGSVLNDSRNLRQNWGPADFDARHRFVSNFVLNFPNVRGGRGLLGTVLSGWSGSGVVTIQTGQPLTFTDSRSGTIYGFSNQRAQLCPGMTASDIATSGSTESRLDNYFNASAFCAPNTIGNGFDFGDSGRGIIYGPGQHNADLALIKDTRLKWLETSMVEFRAEFYNALNTPQFSATTAIQGATAPTAVGSLNFGQITTTSVSPRIIQFGLKFMF